MFAFIWPPALIVLLATSSIPLVNAQGSRAYTILNNCPSTIDVFIGGSIDSTLSSGASITRTLGVNAGFFYTTANGGSTNGAATRAGFYGDNGVNYYYIVRDSDHFNTGISITPNKSPANGFCPIARCDNASCTTAFSQAPTRFPPGGSTPPAPPVYACSGSDLAYTVTFCPSGSFASPDDTATALNPNDFNTKCIDVRGAVYANGTPVQIYDCNGTGAQKWVLQRGPTKVRVAGTNFCLDAGSSPASGVKAKIWQCYDGLAAQNWYYTNDGRISLQNSGQCLDLTEGDRTNSNQLQTWSCTANNLNQVWSRQIS